MSAVLAPAAEQRVAPERTSRVPDAPAPPREYLAFRIAAEQYGIDILRVQEIRSYEAPTRIANAPPGVLGVIDLRGAVVPVLDLRLALGVGNATYDAFTVVVVVNVGARVVGVVVDAVCDVIEPPAGCIHPLPAMACEGADRLTGVASLDGRTVLLLDIQALLASPQFGLAGH